MVVGVLYDSGKRAFGLGIVRSRSDAGRPVEGDVVAPGGGGVTAGQPRGQEQVGTDLDHERQPTDDQGDVVVERHLELDLLGEDPALTQPGDPVEVGVAMEILDGSLEVAELGVGEQDRPAGAEPVEVAADPDPEVQQLVRDAEEALGRQDVRRRLRLVHTVSGVLVLLFVLLLLLFLFIGKRGSMLLSVEAPVRTDALGAMRAAALPLILARLLEGTFSLPLPHLELEVEPVAFVGEPDLVLVVADLAVGVMWQLRLSPTFGPRPRAPTLPLTLVVGREPEDARGRRGE